MRSTRGSDPKCGAARPRRRALAQALAAALGLGTLGSVQGLAATITVNTTADETTTNGLCSLREAIANANSNSKGAADCAAGNGADTIVFDPGIFPPGALTASQVTMGVMTLTDTSPTTIDGGGGAVVDGGNSSVLFKTAAGTTTHFTSLTIRNGSNTRGGAIFNGGTATVDRCTLAGNTGLATGGAIYTTGPLTITNSTISGNTTSLLNGSGGGVYCYVCTSLSIVNSTITGNTSAHGGGIFKRYGLLSLTNVTLSANSATIDGQNLNVYDVGYGAANKVNLVNTIISGSPADNCHLHGGTPSVQDHGSNIDDGATCFATPAVLYSFQYTQPHLSALGDYGGPTLTMMPDVFSTEVDQGSCAAAPATDQRGVARPQGHGCDIGAVEMTGSTITVNTTADEILADGKCSLREALYNAGGNAGLYSDCRRGIADDTIVFDPAVFPTGTLTTITLATGALSPSDTSLRGYSTIDGRGAVAIDGAGTSQIFVTSPYTMWRFKGLTLRNGKSSFGGAIGNFGSMLLERCTITGNTATKGGAVFNGSHLGVYDSTLAANVASPAGLGGAIYNQGDLMLVNSTLTQNNAFEGGALFVHSSSAVLRNTTIAGNFASIGNAIYLNGPDSLTSYATVHDSIIAGAPGGDNCQVAPGLSITDVGGNIDDGPTCGFTAADFSKPHTNALLGPLRANGGPTPTMIPLQGSPAIDAVDCEGDFDQRGVARPQGAKCDIGAVESDAIFGGHFDPPPPPCAVNADCPAGADPQCSAGVCTNSTCSIAFSPIGAACSGGTCDGAGKCVQ